MKALSIKQPWGYLVAAGYKDIENRPWRIGRNSQYGPYQNQQGNFGLDLPARVYIHTGKGKDVEAIRAIIDCLIPDFDHDAYANIYMMERNNTWALGAVIGEVDIIKCVKDSKSPWAEPGQYHLVMDNATLYKTPVKCPGQLGFFTLPDTVISEIKRLNGG
jgi:hypothetical protein